jgi:hypothetical protein
MNAFIGLLVTVFCSPSRAARGCSCKRAQSVVQAANEVAHPEGWEFKDSLPMKAVGMFACACRRL